MDVSAFLNQYSVRAFSGGTARPNAEQGAFAKTNADIREAPQGKSASERIIRQNLESARAESFRAHVIPSTQGRFEGAPRGSLIDITV